MRSGTSALRYLLLVTALGVAGAGVPTSASPAALPAAVDDRHGPLSLSGAGELRWFGLPIYDASFWTSPGTSAWPVDEPGTRVLHITYRRTIRASRLVDTTVEEWRRLALADEDQIQAWSAELARIWPDVKPGDSLSVVHGQADAAWFYANGQSLGGISDPRFGPAFLAIWLHPDSRDARLRTALASGSLP